MISRYDMVTAAGVSRRACPPGKREIFLRQQGSSKEIGSAPERAEFVGRGASHLRELQLAGLELSSPAEITRRQRRSGRPRPKSPSGAPDIDRRPDARHTRSELRKSGGPALPGGARRTHSMDVPMGQQQDIARVGLDAAFGHDMEMSRPCRSSAVRILRTRPERIGEHGFGYITQTHGSFQAASAKPTSVTEQYSSPEVVARFRREAPPPPPRRASFCSALRLGSNPAP
jgi:hypothetical protein